MSTYESWEDTIQPITLVQITKAKSEPGLVQGTLALEATPSPQCL